MPQVLEYTGYDCFLNFVVSSPRPEGIPSTISPNAKMHNQLASTLRGHLREFKHRFENGRWVPTVMQINTYLPPTSGDPYYALRKLQPLGSMPEVLEKYFLDILRIRYGLFFVVNTAGVLAAENTGLTFEFHWENAWKNLLIARGMKYLFTSEDEESMNGDRTEIQISLEVGPASAQQNFDVPVPS